MPNIRIIRLMCSGRVDPAFIFRSFANGHDGVFIGGCLLGECHYITEGNYDALNLVHLCKKIMEHKGIDPARLRLEGISAAEGGRFAEIMNDFGKTLKEMGPLGSEGVSEEKLRADLEEVMNLIPYIKTQMRSKLERRLPKLADYDDLYSLGEIENLFAQAPTYHIDPEKCQACMICSKRCPVKAISGARDLIHAIDQEKCIKCGACHESCPPRYGAVQKLCGVQAPAPLPEEDRRIVRVRSRTKAQS
jgi:F420-non-reducing hydrogenase iron-sulfur subunit